MSTVQPRAGLFTDADFELYGFSVEIGEAEVLNGLARLSRLRALFHSGIWSSLTESNVEQSFVERVFGDVFGYSTLLGDSVRPDKLATIHSIPKLYVPIVDRGGVFPDLSLGYFRADSRQTITCAEFKSPNTDLDAPQTSGKHKGMTPVAQGMRAAVAASAMWCIISNTHEVRLYRPPNANAYELVNLLEVLSPLQFRRAFALLSRRSLLGRNDRSPLSVLYEHLKQGESMLTPKLGGHVRIYQRARVFQQEREVSFARLSKALRRGLQKVNRLNGGSREVMQPRLEGDQLVIDQQTSSGVGRIATNRAGLLVCSTSISMSSPEQSKTGDVSLDSARVLEQLALMFLFAKLFYKFIFDDTPRLSIEWGMEDLGDHVCAFAQKWTLPSPSVHLRCQAGVERVSTPSVDVPSSTWIDQDFTVKILAEVVTELFFPFGGRDAFGQFCRLDPAVSEVRECLESRNCLRDFGYYVNGRFVDPLADDG